MASKIGALRIGGIGGLEIQTNPAIPTGNTGGLLVYPPQPYNLGAEHVCPVASCR